MRTSELAAVYRVYHRSYCTKDTVQKTQKVIHPYRMIHPWKSETEFTNSILKNVIYNAGKILLYLEYNTAVCILVLYFIYILVI